MADKSKRIYIERMVMLAKIESTAGVDALPTPGADAFLVGNVELTLDPQILERDNYRPSFSPTPGEVGRKPFTMSFTHEIKGSGAANIRSKLGVLLRGVRMRETLVTAGAASQIEDPIIHGEASGPEVTWAKTAAPTQRYGSYLIRCVKGGASATAELQVFRWNQSDRDNTVMWNTRFDAVKDFAGVTTLSLNMADETAPVFTVGGTVTLGDSIYAVVGGMVYKHTVDATDMAGIDNAARLASVATRLAAKIDAESLFTAAAVAAVITVGFAAGADSVVVTSGATALALGDSGATITPTWAGNLVVGQQWIVQLYEVGYMYRPTSDAETADTLTLYAYVDGQLYRLLGTVGNVSMEGTSGDYGSASFEFTGQYIAPVPQPLPISAIRYERTKPPKVELAQLSIRGSQDFCAESFTVELGNDVQERLCMNEADGYAGSEISDRAPTLTVNPEGSLDVYTSMWGDFASGEEVPVHLRVGKKTGNMVRIYADRATYTGLTMSERNRVQVAEPTFQCNGVSDYGDDELRFMFP